MITETGLVAAYDFTKNGDKIADLSGNGFTLSRNGPILKSNKGITSSGGRYITTKSNTFCESDFSISFRFYNYGITASLIQTIVAFGATSTSWVWVYLRETGNLMLDPGSGGVATFVRALKQYTTYTITLTFENATHTTKCYINGVFFGSDVLYNPSGLRASIMSIGNYSNGYSGFGKYRPTLINLKIHSRIISEKEIKNYHNGFVSIPAINEDFSNYPVGTISNFGPWVKRTGAFSIQELTNDEIILKYLKRGTKYLKCTTAGYLGLKSNIAYGTWEFDWFKGADANNIIVGFISPSLLNLINGGYYFHPQSDESIRIIIRQSDLNVALTQVSPGFFQNSVWYTIKIIRTAAGITTYWIKGGRFGNSYQLMPSEVAGSNPFTNNTFTFCEYFVFDIDANDCIANLKIYPGIIL